MPTPRWTITALTIPGREHYLRQLIQSIEATVIPGGARLVIVYNRAIRDDLADVERTIRSWSDSLDIEVHFNNGDPTISGGRNYQLNLVKSPLVCFVDDDITVHGDAFLTIEEAMQRLPAGLFGLRSYREDTEELFKPRDGTSHVITGEFRYQSVQGMLVASYTNLLRDVGGFNPRRRFWGEWTELNLRMWRSGFPTGHVMEGGYLRHWEKAPDSPTRNMDGRAKHVLWGLICTALEYDAVDMSQATETFWRLVQDRYLAYSFGEELSHQELLRATLELVPDLSAEWAAITAFRDEVAKHPFDFKPFQPLTEKDLQRVLPTARRKLRRYRWLAWPQRTAARKFGAALGKLLVRPPKLALEPDDQR